MTQPLPDPDSYAPGLDPDGYNRGDEDVILGGNGTVLKQRPDGTRCGSNYIGPGEKVVATTQPR